MKFSELKIGDEFQTVKNRGYFKKIEETNDENNEAINSILFFNNQVKFVYFHEYTEVTQINKKACRDCKFLDECLIVGLLEECVVVEGIESDIDTFYCSEFQRKEG